MKVLLRADASPLQGTGHVMRCLTLAEELVRRGHEVHLLTNESEVDWLEKVMAAATGVIIHRTIQHSLNPTEVARLAPDWVVTDSYEIPADQISAVRATCSVMAIIDGDDRGIHADLYLDHNLGAESGVWADSTRERLLAGSEFALIRDAILERRRNNPWLTRSPIPHIVAVMGGSDPTGTIVRVASALCDVDGKFTASIVVDSRWRQDVERTLEDKPGCNVLAPTAGLPDLLGSADIAISASGTSAWELCTLGIPSLLIAVVENQSDSLARMVEQGLVVGLDLTKEAASTANVTMREDINLLLSNDHKREELSRLCLESFDGQGKQRVVAAMEASGHYEN